MPSLLAKHDADIKKLSWDIGSLQDRMLALEKSMIEVRTDLRASSTIGMSSAQDLLMANSDIMLGAARDVSSVGEAMEDLRSENERLKQRLRTMESPMADRVKDESVEAAAGMTMVTFPSAPTEHAKMKRPYTRRKASAAPESVTPATADLDSSYAPDCGQDDPSQLGGLAALNEITAALTRASSTGELRTSNGPANHIYDGNSTQDMSRTNPGLSEANDLVTSEQRSSRTSDEMIDDDEEEAATHAQKKKKTTDSIARMDDTMIDPALRSASVPANQEFPVPKVLSSIENPPGQRQPGQSEPHKKTSRAPQYDSVHEARIREHKARDALRKRKTRAILNEKKKKDGEVQFKQEEKVRARDRMVKELMEREEMLESDGDL